MGGQTPATDKNADLGFLWQVQRPVRLGQTAHNPNKLCGENWHMQYYLELYSENFDGNGGVQGLTQTQFLQEASHKS